MGKLSLTNTKKNCALSFHLQLLTAFVFSFFLVRLTTYFVTTMLPILCRLVLSILWNFKTMVTSSTKQIPQNTWFFFCQDVYSSYNRLLNTFLSVNSNTRQTFIILCFSNRQTCLKNGIWRNKRVGCFSCTHRAEKDTAFYKVGLTHNAWVCFMRVLSIKLLYLCHQHFFQFVCKNLFHSGNTSTCYTPLSPTCLHRVHHFNATTATCFYTQVHTSPGGLQQNHDCLKL
jgi:hypothetical protein